MVGGRVYWSPQQMASIIVAGLLFVWGMVWVLHVMNYGMCKQEVVSAKMTLAHREHALVRGQLQKDQELWEMVELVQEFDEVAVGMRDAYQEYRLPIVMACSTASSIMEQIPAGRFAAHVVTTAAGFADCVAKVEKVESVRRVETVAEGSPRAMLAAAAQLIMRSLVYPMNHMAVVEGDVAFVSPDGLELFHALAAQGVLGGAGPAVATLGWGRKEVPHPSQASLTSLVVRSKAAPSHAFIFPVSEAAVVLKAFQDGSDVDAAMPLYPRCHSVDHAPARNAPCAPHCKPLPVLFGAVDLSHIQSDASYKTWEARQVEILSPDGAAKGLGLSTDKDGYAILTGSR